MCVAVLQKPESFISDDVIYECSKWNKDGYGISYIENKELKIYVTLNLKLLSDELLRLKTNSEIRRYPIMIHFRAGSNPILENCHPFRVTNDIVFCHNGYINQHKSTVNAFSDTYNFNVEIMKPLCNYMDIFSPEHYDGVKTLLGYYVGSNNKLIIMHSSGKYMIINEETGIWDNNIWYSNTGYKPFKPASFPPVTEEPKKETAKGVVVYDSLMTPCNCCGKLFKKHTLVFVRTPKFIRYYCGHCLINGKISKQRVKELFRGMV